MLNSADTKKRLLALSQGDRVAFERVYNFHFSAVYRYCLSYLKVKEVAEETTVDVFVTIYNIRSRIDPDRPLRALLLKIARDKVYTRLRKIATSAERSRAFLSSLSVTPSPTTPEEAYLHNEMDQQIQRSIELLPPRCGEVFALHHRGNDHQQIARRLTISPNTVRAHLVKARRLLRGLMGRDYLLED